MGLALCFEGFRAKNNATTVMNEVYKKKNRNEVDQKIHNLVLFANDNRDQLIPIARLLHQKIQTFLKTHDEANILISCTAVEEITNQCSDSLDIIIQSIKKVILELMEQTSLIYKIKGTELVSLFFFFSKNQVLYNILLFKFTSKQILKVAERSGNDVVVFSHEIESLIPLVIENMTIAIDPKDVQYCYKLRATSLKCIEMMTAERWNTSKYIEGIVEGILKNMNPKISASAQDADTWTAEKNRVFSSDIPRDTSQDDYSPTTNSRRARRTVAFVYQRNNPFLLNPQQKFSDPNLVLTFGNIKTLAMECFSKLILGSTYIPLRNVIRTTMRFMIETEQYKDLDKLLEIFSIFINIFIRTKKNTLVFLAHEITSFIEDLVHTEYKKVIQSDEFRANLLVLFDLIAKQNRKNIEVFTALKKKIGLKEDTLTPSTKDIINAGTSQDAANPTQNPENGQKQAVPATENEEEKKPDAISSQDSSSDLLSKKSSSSNLAIFDLSSLTMRKNAEKAETGDQWFFQMFTKDPTEEAPAATLIIPTEPEPEVQQKLSETIDEKMNLPSIGEIVLEKYEKDMAALEMIFDAIPKDQDDEEDFLESDDQAELEEIVLNEMNKPEFILPSLFISEQF